MDLLQIAKKECSSQERMNKFWLNFIQSKPNSTGLVHALNMINCKPMLNLLVQANFQMCTWASQSSLCKKVILVFNHNKLFILSTNQTWKWILSGEHFLQSENRNQKNSSYIINFKKKKLNNSCFWEKWSIVNNRGKKIFKKSMTHHLRKKLTPESSWKGKEKELNLLSRENIKRLKRQLKMIYFYSKIVSSKLNPSSGRSGPTAKLQSQSPSCLCKQTHMIVWLTVMFLALKKDFLWNWKEKD